MQSSPYEKDIKKFESKGSLFVKGLEKNWSHKDLYEYMSRYGDVSSVKISLTENHLSRGYGFVLFSKEEFAQQAIASVRFRYKPSHHIA